VSDDPRYRRRAGERRPAIPLADAQKPENAVPEVATDLVEYLVIAAPDRESLASLVPALTDLVESERIRVLDMVVVVRDSDGTIEMCEVDRVDSVAALAGLQRDVGGMLSEHDIALASLALGPNSAGIVVVSEDRWAAPLSAAARDAGGSIVGGDRIPASRVEAALVERSRNRGKGA
jgi:hypothetical protein